MLVIRKELAAHDLREENRILREALGLRYEYASIIARSEKMQAVLAMVERVAPTNATVLLGGESGVERYDRSHAIHEHSRSRAREPFVKISTAPPSRKICFPESEAASAMKGRFLRRHFRASPGKFEAGR